MLINFKNKVAINYFQVFTKFRAPAGVLLKQVTVFVFSEMESDSDSWRVYVVRSSIRYMPGLEISPKNSLCATQKPVKCNGCVICVWPAVVLTLEKS